MDGLRDFFGGILAVFFFTVVLTVVFRTYPQVFSDYFIQIVGAVLALLIPTGLWWAWNHID